MQHGAFEHVTTTDPAGLLQSEPAKKPGRPEDASVRERLSTGAFRSEVDFLAKLEQQREDRRAWAEAVQAAETAAAMAAMLERSSPPEPEKTGVHREIAPDPEGQRQLDVALRIVRMPDVSGLRFELRL